MNRKILAIITLGICLVIAVAFATYEISMVQKLQNEQGDEGSWKDVGSSANVFETVSVHRAMGRGIKFF